LPKLGSGVPTTTLACAGAWKKAQAAAIDTAAKNLIFTPALLNLPASAAG
jgi:hypothetical protein